MKALFRRHHLAAALLCLPMLAGAAPAAPAAPAAADTAVTFDTTPRPGQHQLQKHDIQAVMKIRVEPGPDATPEEREKIAQGAQRLADMGTMKLAMKMQQTIKVDQPDANGWLPLTFATNNQGSTMEVGGKVMPLPQSAPDMVLAARFNPADFAFQIQQINGSPEAGEAVRAKAEAMVNEALQLFKTLKNRSLKVGESVDIPLNMALPMPMAGGAGSMAANVRYTLKRVAQGVAYFDLSLDLKMDIDTPVPAPAASAPADGASAPPAAPPQMLHITATGTGKGAGALRLSDRLMLSNQLVMDMTMNMRMPGNAQMTIDMNMQMQSKGESLAKPAAAPGKAGAKPEAKKK